MSACIIEKKDLERLGQKLMKEFYDHIHDEYFLTEYDEVKLKRKYYDENLTEEFLSFYKNKEKKIRNLYFDNKRYKDLVEMKTEILFKKIEGKIKDETLDYKIIYNFLDQMDRELKISKDMDHDIHEDLFYMKKAFIHIFEVFHYDHYFLKE